MVQHSSHKIIDLLDTLLPHSSCLYLVGKRTLLSLIELVDAFSSIFLEIKVCG